MGGFKSEIEITPPLTSRLGLAKLRLFIIVLSFEVGNPNLQGVPTRMISGIVKYRSNIYPNTCS